MKTIYSKKTVLVTIVAALTGNVFAQQNQEQQDLSREMTLEREYNPTVQDAGKVNTLPSVREPEVRKSPIEYAPYSIPMDPDKEINVLPSGNIMTDILYNSRKGYFNFGIGTYTNVNGDIGYHILDTEQDKLNIYFSHRSTNGKVKYMDGSEKVKAKLNDNLGGINYKHSFTNADFKIGARYGYTGFNYYGQPYNSLSSNFDLDTYQGNQQFAIQTGIISNENSPVGYHVNLDYTNFSHRYSFAKDMDGMTENSVVLKGGLFAPFKDVQRIGIDARIDFFGYNLPAVLEGRYKGYTEVTVSPYYNIRESNLDVKFGVNLMLITGNNSKFFVSPNLAAQIEFVDKTVLYVDATGKIQSNSAYQLSQINRYIDPTIGVAPSRTWLDANLGIKSGIVPGFWFDVFAGYKITSDDVFFVLDPITGISGMNGWGNVSSASYMNSKAFKGGFELKYAYQKYFDLYIKTVYNNWNVDSGRKAYGKPQLEFSTGIDIRPVERVTLAIDYQVASGRYGWYGTNEIKMKNINELNAFASYAVTDVIGAYIKINNLLSRKYELLPGYPLQSFNAMVGVNFNF